MASPVLGIDLGTTNSVVAYADESRVRVLRDEEGHLLTPSCVSFGLGGETSVGFAARDLRLIDAQNTVFSVKRLIGRPFRSLEVRSALQRLPFKLEEGPTGGVVVSVHGETFSLPEIASFILRRLRDVAEQALGASCVNAVITVPANFNELQRMATRDAGRIAGLNVLRILNEPTAAALAYGYRAQQSQRIAVYDFGGGTFDISILELSGEVIEVVATAGDTHLGGDDLDRVVADRMVAEFEAQHGIDLKRTPQQYERITMAAEWLKCQLSELEAAEATIKQVAGGLDLKFRLGRGELRELCSPLIESTFVICEDALRLAGVRPSQLDAVILVGGQTRTPRVREMVAEYFGMQPKYSVDPDLAVAQGAALQGYALSGVPAADLDRRVVRTLSGPGGPGSLPPPAADPFEDEPTRIADRDDFAADRDDFAADRDDFVVETDADDDSPFDDIPTTISRAQHVVHAALAYGPPSVRPDRPVVMHSSTLAGMGDPKALAAGEARVFDPEAVTRDLPALEARPPAPFRTTAETPRAKAAERRSKLPPGDPELLPVPPPPAALGGEDIAFDEMDADLPAVLRASESATPANDDDDETKLLDSRRAKAHTLPPAGGEPIRTLTMARQLTAQGYLERALSIYAELLIKDPNATELIREARALRVRLVAPDTQTPVPPMAAGVASAPPHAAASRTQVSGSPLMAAGPAAATQPVRVSAKPPPPPPRGRPTFNAPVSAPAEASIAGASERPSMSGGGTSERAAVVGASERAALGAASPMVAASARAPLAGPSERAQAGGHARARPSVAPARARSNWSPAARSEEEELSGPTRVHTPIPAPRSPDVSSQFPGPPSVAPLLLDVTPHTLCVETVAGFCEQIIERNAPIPTEQTRIFSTSRDNQVTVSVRVCQGESRRIEENQVLGQIDLLGLRQARRGDVSIAVTFVLDADGTLNVRAIDEGTGRGQELEVNLVGAIETPELERMRLRHRAMTG